MTAASPTHKIRLTENAGTVTVHIPITFRQRGGRKQILTPPGSAAWSPAPRMDTALLKAIVRAHRWREMLEDGKYLCTADLAKAEKINASYLARILRLTLLAPEIIEAILSGHQSSALQLNDLLKPLPAIWTKQRSALRL
jgi:hypothetical protein